MKCNSYESFIEETAKRLVPISVALELTSACNLNCLHCYQPSHTMKPGELTTAEWGAVLESLAEMGCLFLTLTGGEMFTRPDALDICTAARAMGYALRLFTNGTFLNEKTVKDIANIHPLSVEVSIYGSNARTHDGITGKAGSFDLAVSAARSLAGKGAPVIVKSPIMSVNADELEDMRNLSERLGAELRLDLDVVPADDGSKHPLALRLSENELRQVLSIDWVRERFVVFHDERPAEDSDICGAARRTCAISSTGDVYPCIQIPISAGNLRERSFGQIWRESPVLWEFREKRVGDLCRECRSCPRVSYCGRCGALALLEDGDYLGVSSWACRVADAKEAAAGTCR